MVKNTVIFALLILATTALIGQSTYSLTEIRKHNRPADCWLAIHGSVYDVTKYVQKHLKFDFDIAPYCGTEASDYWNKKPESGESHSRKAGMLLKKYKIGELKK